MATTDRRSENMSESELRSSETVELIGSDKVEGTHVFNRQGQHLGQIEKVMIDKHAGKVAYAVMSFGGILGMGEEHYPLPWEVLDYDTGVDGYVIELDKAKLEGAPSFVRGSEPAWQDPLYNREIYGHYGLAYPYPLI
ncbi:MAG TPA: PRC-barrel domain-containing protein [Paracoccaceae bacterium]|nr:PRC-barrel domain-containing protein [Paracoccaceae bacterium]